MGSFKTSKSSSTSGPAAYTAPYVQNALQSMQDTVNRQQPIYDGLGGIAALGAANMARGAFDTSPYVSNAQGAARAISNGYFLGGNPGQSTYAGMMGAGGGAQRGMMGGPVFGGGARKTADPSMGALTQMANAPGANPANGFASAVADGQYLNRQPSAGLYSGMMGSDYVNQNPYLDSVINQTNADVAKNANRMFASRGMGSGVGSAFADVLSKNLASNEGQLRYQNYNDASNRQLQAAGQSDAAYGAERGRMDASTGLLASNYNSSQAQQLAAAQALGAQYSQGQDRSLEAAKASDASQQQQVQQMLQALGLTGQLSEAQYAGVNPTLAALNAGASIPLMGVNALQGGIANLTGATNSSTSKSSGPGLLYNAVSNAASAAASAKASDRRLKTNIEKRGELEDGLGVYDFDYIDPRYGEGRQRGVMADEVASLRPWAIGPKIDGEYATVAYGAL